MDIFEITKTCDGHLSEAFITFKHHMTTFLDKKEINDESLNNIYDSLEDLQDMLSSYKKLLNEEFDEDLKEEDDSFKDLRVNSDKPEKPVKPKTVGLCKYVYSKGVNKDTQCSSKKVDATTFLCKKHNK